MYLELSDIRELWNIEYIKNIKEKRENNLNSDFTNNKMADFSENWIIKAKEVYYIGEPIMSDQSFDWLEDRLKTLRPNSEILDKVG